MNNDLQKKIDLICYRPNSIKTYNNIVWQKIKYHDYGFIKIDNKLYAFFTCDLKTEKIAEYKTSLKELYNGEFDDYKESYNDFFNIDKIRRS